jgi:hypothetical protein
LAQLSWATLPLVLLLLLPPPLDDQGQVILC